SENRQLNKCTCFPILNPPIHNVRIPVQVARCSSGKNNGLFARCAFERGTAVGEFVGLVTKGIEGVDVMMGGRGDAQYQIYQGRLGNYTRFINHSCAPNAQFTKFMFCGIERILVVSKGIEAGMEITVDYSSSYWNKLDKTSTHELSMTSSDRSTGELSTPSVPRRILPKRARKETSYYPSESGSENEAEDDEEYNSEEETSLLSKKPKPSAADDAPKFLPKKKIFPFMSLPAEIKNIIYEYALTSEYEIPLVFKLKGYRHTVTLGDPTTFQDFRRRAYREDFDGPSCCRYYPPARVSRPSLAPSVLALNHETHMQAQSILYSYNAFALEDPKALLAFCANIGPKNCAMLQEVNLKHFGKTVVRRALCYPAFTALANAVNLQILNLDCSIRGCDPILTARQFFRDGHNWLEAVGAKEGRRDAAVDRIELGPQNVSRSRYGVPSMDDLTDEQKSERVTTIFQTELRRLLKA
ncbi:MAG: hypothetical protein Q9180_005992, partial [Flavoplaca navasiana]